MKQDFTQVINTPQIEAGLFEFKVNVSKRSKDRPGFNIVEGPTDDALKCLKLVPALLGSKDSSNVRITERAPYQEVRV